MKTKKEMRAKRKAGIRAKISGTGKRPRLAVFRSNRVISVQLIDDSKKKTIASVGAKGKNRDAAKTVGTAIAQIAKEKKITTVVFDRGGFRYHGVLAALADAAREGGLAF